MNFDKLSGMNFAGLSVGRVTGKSAAGVTYVAEREGGTYALKVLPPRLSKAGNESASRFLAELETAGNLEHENLIRIFEVGEEQGFRYVLTEFMDVPTLADRVKGKGALPVEEAVSILGQVLAGCGAAHDAGLVHGELKPSGIFLSPDGTVKIAGFGLSKKLLYDARVSLPGFDIETVEYISPEQVAASEIDARTDLYALGVIAFEMLVGKPPFIQESLIALRMLHSIETPPNPHEENPDVPLPLSAFILKLLAKEPNQRFPDAASASKSLEIAMSAGAPVEVEETAPPKEPAAETDVREEGLVTAGEKPASLSSEVTGILADMMFEDEEGAVAETPLEKAAETAGPPLEEVGLSEDDRKRIEENLVDAERFLKKGDVAGALDLLREARELDASEPRVQKMLGKAEDAQAAYLEKSAAFERFREEGDVIELEKLAKEILELKPDDPEARSYLDSLAALKASAPRKEEVDRHVLKVHRLIQQRNLEEALERVRQALDIDPERSDVRSLKDQVEEKLDRISSLWQTVDESYKREEYKGALEACEELRDLVENPHDVDAWVEQIGTVYVDVDGLLSSARKAWEEKSFREAEEAVQEILRADPGNKRAAQLEKQMELFHRELDVARDRAREHLNQGSYQLAKDQYLLVLNLLPDDEEAQEQIRVIEKIFKRDERGRFRKFVLAGTVLVLLVAIVLIGYFGLKDRKLKALNKAEKLITKMEYHEAEQVLDRIGDFLVDVERRDALRARLNRERMGTRPPPTAKTPVKPYEAILRAASAQLGFEAWEEVLALVEKAVEKGAPDDLVEPLVKQAKTGMHLEAGREAEGKGDWETALAEYRKLKGFDPSMASGAIEPLFRKKLKAAEASKETDPEGYVKQLRKLGKAFGREGEIQTLLDSTSIDPRLETAVRARASGEWRKAVRLLREAAGNPAAAKMAVNMIEKIEKELAEKGNNLFDRGDFGEAVRILTDLAALFPAPEYKKSLEKARYNDFLKRGEALLGQGKAEESIEILVMAEEIGLDDRAETWLKRAKLRLWLNRAETLEKERKWAEASEAYKRILELDPGNHAAVKRIAHLTGVIEYESFIERMDAMFKERDFFETLHAANDAMATGLDDGTAKRAVTYLKPLLKMKYIPPGAFTMGDEEGREREKPSHEVEVAGFYITENEVTVEEYTEFLATPAGQGHEPEKWEAQKENPDHPVTGVSLDDARAYAKSFYFEIPTEAQWEKAARGSDRRAYPWGKEFHPEYANTYEIRIKSPAPVTEYEKDVSPFGCLNMAGNVAEWTVSPFRSYPGGTGEFSEGRVVIRGGDFRFGRKYARCASRRAVSPEARKGFIGFRVIRRITIRSLRELE